MKQNRFNHLLTCNSLHSLLGTGIVIVETFGPVHEILVRPFYLSGSSLRENVSCAPTQAIYMHHDTIPLCLSTPHVFHTYIFTRLSRNNSATMWFLYLTGQVHPDDGPVELFYRYPCPCLIFIYPDICSIYSQGVQL